VAHIFLERREPGDDQRRLFELLGEDQPARSVSGECVPPLDVVETQVAIEILMDLPGVSADAVKVVFLRGTVVIAGHKLPSVCPHEQAAFHLAQRAFGRFARAVRVAGAFDAGRATATLVAGELRVVLPRIDERRGREIRIAVTPA
jgi:HSP20 family protein